MFRTHAELEQHEGRAAEAIEDPELLKVAEIIAERNEDGSTCARVCVATK
jgi:hypothetical protein